MYVSISAKLYKALLSCYINKAFAKKSIRTLISKAGYGRWRMGNSFMESLTLKHLLEVSIISKYIAFEEFEGDVFCRPSPQANLKGCGSRDNAVFKMELFD